MLTRKVRADTLKPGQFHVDGKTAGARKIQRIVAIRETQVPARAGGKKKVPAIELELSNGLNQASNTIIYKPSAPVRTRA